jgi:protein-disulfide isomerase
MPQTLHRTLRTLRILLAASLAGACSRSGGTPSSNAAQKPAATAAANASADGILATAVPQGGLNEQADHGRILGDSTAKVWVVMASDFQCPYCKTWHDAAFQELMKTYVNTGRVRLAFLNMPLSIHQNAVPASEAAMCASVQNKFWPMHEALFATQAKWEVMPDPVPLFDSLATTYKVDMGPWRQCMSQHAIRPLIQADHDRASSSGVNSTPTFFVDGQRFSGADANLAPAIEAALAKNAKKPTS